MATDETTMWSLATLKRIGAAATGRLRLTVNVAPGEEVLAEIGSTGERDITGMLQNVKSGKLTVARFGPLVTYNIEEIELTHPATTSLRAGVAGLEMMTPNMGLKACALATADGGDLARFGVSAGGVIALWGAAATGTNKYSGSLTFSTEKAWGTLPGVKNGDPVVVGV
jgi:hypothetical protein